MAPLLSLYFVFCVTFVLKNSCYLLHNCYFQARLWVVSAIKYNKINLLVFLYPSGTSFA